MGRLTAGERAALRRTLREAAPWLAHPELGPAAVTAGECDRCGHEPRLVQPCGPPPDDLGGRASPDWALGRRCAMELGPAGWCDGHQPEARAAVRWLAALPDQADDLARLWWLATGEVRVDPDAERRARRMLDG